MTFPNPRLDFRPPRQSPGRIRAAERLGWEPWPGAVAGPHFPTAAHRASPAPSCSRRVRPVRAWPGGSSEGLQAPPERQGFREHLSPRAGLRATLACSSSSSPAPSLTRVPACATGGGALCADPFWEGGLGSLWLWPSQEHPLVGQEQTHPTEVPSGLLATARDMFLKHLGLFKHRKTHL